MKTQVGCHRSGVKAHLSQSLRINTGSRQYCWCRQSAGRHGPSSGSLLHWGYWCSTPSQTTAVNTAGEKLVQRPVGAVENLMLPSRCCMYRSAWKNFASTRLQDPDSLFSSLFVSLIISVCQSIRSFHAKCTVCSGAPISCTCYFAVPLG